MALFPVAAPGPWLVLVLLGLGIVNRSISVAIALANQLARSMYQESLSLCRELGDASRIALNLYNLGTAASCQGDYPQARFLTQYTY